MKEEQGNCSSNDETGLKRVVELLMMKSITTFRSICRTTGIEETWLTS
jgi:hypothetical protein